MKTKKLIIFMMAFSYSVFACYFSSNLFKHAYIAGVNNYEEHYANSNYTDNSNTYINGQYASSPITVYVKVEKMVDPVNEQHEIKGPIPISKAVLQYKIAYPSKYETKWITVNEIKDVQWNMDFDYPVPLFGKNCINLKGYPKDTIVLIRIYLECGLIKSGILTSDDINYNNIPNLINGPSDSNWSHGNSGWTAPFIYKIKLTGKERAR